MQWTKSTKIWLIQFLVCTSISCAFTDVIFSSISYVYLRQLYVRCIFVVFCAMFERCVQFSEHQNRTLRVMPAIILPMKSKNSCTLLLLTYTTFHYFYCYKDACFFLCVFLSLSFFKYINSCSFFQFLAYYLFIYFPTYKK